MSLPIRYIAIGILFLIHFVLGYWLRWSGKPYHGAVSTLHKLASLAALVLIALTIKQLWPDTSLDGLELVALVTTGLLFLITILSGGWLSADKPPNAAVSALHKVTPYLVLLSTVATLYLFAAKTP